MARQASTRSLVERFVAELRAVIQMDALDVVRAALGEATPKRRGPRRPRKVAERGPGRPPEAARRGRPKKAAGRARRSAGDLERTSAKVLAYVRSNAGRRLEEIGQGLKTATAELKRPIQSLLAGGALRTEGQKRGTRYFAAGRKGRGKTKAAKKLRKAKTRKPRARRSKRKARKAPVRRAVREVTVRPRSKPAIQAKGAKRIALEAVPEMVPTEMASAAT